MNDVDNAVVGAVCDYIKSGKLMSLATTDGRRLYMCSVWFAHSEDFRHLYFTSRDTRRHSENIRNNGRVSGSIIAIELEGLGQRTQGAFFTGTAREAGEGDIDRCYENYRERWPQVANMFSAEDVRTGGTPMRMYDVSVEEYVWIDEVASPGDPRFVIPADAL